MIFHPIVFWIIFSIVLIIVLYPFLLLFAAWCESFKFDFVYLPKQVLLLTIPVSWLPLLCCIVWLSDCIPHIYIIDSSNEVKNRFYLFYDTDFGITPQFETYYVKNQSGKSIYEYKQVYSNANFSIPQNGIVSEITPGKIATLSRKPYSLMKGVPEKIVVSYHMYRPSESTETFIISEKTIRRVNALNTH